MRILAAATAVIGGLLIVSSGQSALAAPNEQSNANQPQNTQKIIKVSDGDHLTKIANDNQSTAERLYYANTFIADPDLIYPGQDVRVPGSEEQLTPRAIPVNEAIPAPNPAVEAAPVSKAQPHAAAPKASKPAATPVVTGSGCAWLSGQLSAAGLNAGEVQAALAIASKESGCNAAAHNRSSGACNVFQEYPCGKWGGSSNMSAHIRGADNYAKSRYGSWAGAYSFWQANKWW